MVKFFRRFFDRGPSEVELFLGDGRGSLNDLGPFSPYYVFGIFGVSLEAPGAECDHDSTGDAQRDC